MHTSSLFPPFHFFPPSLKPCPLQLRIRTLNEAISEALLERLPTRGLAIVGTRYPCRRSLLEVRRILETLNPADNWVIISGLAKGIDEEAHRIALERGLDTLAVLGSGLDEIYPAENRELALRIINQGGALLSEYPDTATPRKHTFLARNRIIAALARATWIVEAGERSGALNTARWTREIGTDLYVSPFHPADTPGQGNRKLLAENAAWALWSSEDLRSTWLALQPSCNSRKKDEIPAHLVDLIRLIQTLTRSTEALSPAELALAWAGQPEQLTPQLLELQKLGKVRFEGGWLVFQDAIR